MMDMDMDSGMESGQEYEGAKMDALKDLVQQMYSLMMDNYDREAMPEELAPPESPMEAAEEIAEPVEEMMGAEDDGLGDEVKDFFSGTKPKSESSEGMAMVISQSTGGKGKKKGRSRRKK